MNIANILKDIRHMKILFENLLLCPHLKFEVTHSHENVIDLDQLTEDEN